jgi:hypothetical protein
MRPLIVLLALASLAAGCAKPPITWVDRTEMSERHPSPLSFPGETVIDTTVRDSTGTAAFAETQDLLREAGARSMVAGVLETMPEAHQPFKSDLPMVPMAMAPAAGNDLGTDAAPLDAARCARSLRMVDAPKRGRVAVWWTRRSNGRVALVAAWRMNDSAGVASPGISGWRGPITIDTLDQGAGDANAGERGAVGCSRPAAGVAVDSANGYVHVAYTLNAPEGPGVFYAHQMDPRAAFEPTTAIAYGDRHLGAARVATSGNLVVVAYEDPNAPPRRGRIGVAVSRTSGHTFESRIDASPLGKAVDPYVGVEGRAAVVGWTELDSTRSAGSGFRMRRGVVR